MENFIYLVPALALIAAGVIGERLRANGSLHFSFSRTEKKSTKRKASGKKRTTKPAASAPAGKRGRPKKSESEQAGA